MYPSPDDTLTTWPDPRATIAGPKAAQPLTTPRRFTPTMASQSSAVVSRKRPDMPIPALFTTMSGTPCSRSTVAASSAMATASLTSAA
jgi:hypothetical protein